MAQPVRAPVQAPSIELGDFQLTVHRREFPDAHDRWDGNWLHVTAQCAQLAAVHASRSGQAELSGAEPNIRVRVTTGGADGRVRVRVELTPDPQTQGHWFEYAIEPGDLAEAIGQLDDVLALFPVRGKIPSLADLERVGD